MGDRRRIARPQREGCRHRRRGLPTDLARIGRYGDDEVARFTVPDALPSYLNQHLSVTGSPMGLTAALALRTQAARGALPTLAVQALVSMATLTSRAGADDPEWSRTVPWPRRSRHPSAPRHSRALTPPTSASPRTHRDGCRLAAVGLVDRGPETSLEGLRPGRDIEPTGKSECPHRSPSPAACRARDDTSPFLADSTWNCRDLFS